ncbi:MAG: hypothetical protein EAZ90_20370 [Oscillatoriales cyanobacterium]|nr:MAG: hypothetical protein EAZ90_20370 [Oscillatoriales cyanobacterium]TAE66171.1 MAG: hypothetical protein EAZ86_21495 [Oscillatoriales cyanobacterium]
MPLVPIVSVFINSATAGWLTIGSGGAGGLISKLSSLTLALGVFWLGVVCFVCGDSVVGD